MAIVEFKGGKEIEFPKAKWVKFIFGHTTGKTDIIYVVPKDSGDALGTVQWFGRWRKYAFFPLSDTVFEQVCLRDIADFCEHGTKEHYKKLKDKKNVASKEK